MTLYLTPRAAERLDEEAGKRSERAGVEVSPEATARGLVYAGLALSVDGNGEAVSPVTELVAAVRAFGDAAKKAGRDAREGVVSSYIHSGGRLGVLVEVNCETDFVARTDGFKELCHEIALQVAAMNPLYVSKDQIPPEVLEKANRLAADLADLLADIRLRFPASRFSFVRC